MSDEISWELPELLMRYELEPQLNDLFVEGVFDKDVLASFMQQTNHNNKKIIYEIDCVNVPNELLRTYKLTEGNKQRVIALSKELSKLPNEVSCRCLVDKDLDHWFAAVEDSKILVVTEYCSLELYFLTKDFLYELLVTTSKSKITDWDEFYSTFIKVLADLYALRLVDKELELCIKWITPDRCLTKDGNKIHFALDDYIDRLLQSRSQKAKKTEFQNCLNKWTPKLAGDYRQFIRGHDLVELIVWTIKKFRGEDALASPNAIMRIFVLIAGRAHELKQIIQ